MSGLHAISPDMAKPSAIPLYPQLKAWRRHLKVNRKDVAEALGVADNTVGRWENFDPNEVDDRDQRPIGMADLVRYCAFLGISPALVWYPPNSSLANMTSAVIDLDDDTQATVIDFVEYHKTRKAH